MSRRYHADSKYPGASAASSAPRENDPEPDPEPPAAPPVIILSRSGQGRVARGSQNQALDPAVEAQPHTSSPPPHSSARANPSHSTRYHLRNKTKHPDPDPDPVPEPDPAPPIIILGNSSNKRAASSSPARSITPPLTTSPTASTASTSPKAQLQHFKAKMGSKASKLTQKAEAATGKLQPSQSKADKEQMKEPNNYYTHRSKSMRRKAGSGQVSGEGSGGGLQ